MERSIAMVGALLQFQIYQFVLDGIVNEFGIGLHPHLL